MDDAVESVLPETERYVFPLTIYTQEGQTWILGLTADTQTSRFKRSLEIEGEHAVLVWQAYLALHPRQEENYGVLLGSWTVRDFTEAVDEYYALYPDYFHVDENVDPRLYGQGGYFYSADGARDLQLEEARRLNFNWEWGYALHQLPGDYWPTEGTWHSDQG